MIVYDDQFFVTHGGPPMTTNHQKSAADDQPPAEPRARGETASTNIILRSLDVEGVVSLIESWENDPDATEQRETLSYLRQALDEDRLSDRTLFR